MLRWLWALGLALLLAGGAAAEEARVALIVGNDAYRGLPRLDNAANDARAMERELKAAGFQTILKIDAGRRELHAAINEFGGRLAAGAVGLFYYAGHGIQAGERNYLVPIDAQLESEDDLEADAIDAGKVLRVMEEARNRLNVVVLDACRDNPLPRKARSTTRGLAVMAAPRGTFVAYAAAPNQQAQDGGKGGNGLFTGELVKALREPGLKIEEVFKRATAGVIEKSAGRQVPWVQASIQGDFYFRPPLAAAAPPPPPQASDKEALFWASIKDSTDRAMFEAYLAQWPNGTFAPIAQARVAALVPAAVTTAVVSAATRSLHSVKETATLRDGPAKTAGKLAVLDDRDLVHVSGSAAGGEWLKVRSAKGEGYIFASLLEVRPAVPERLAQDARIGPVLARIDALWLLEQRHEAFRYLSKVLAQDGRIEEAVAVSAAAESGWNTSTLAVERFEAGDAAGGRRLLEVAMTRDRGLGWPDTVKRLYKAGFAAEARAFAFSLEDQEGSPYRSEALLELAKAEAAAGRFDEAAAAAQVIGDEWKRHSAIAEVAASLAEAGQGERARSLAAGLPTSFAVSIEAAGAVALARAGQREAARAVLDEAWRKAPATAKENKYAYWAGMAHRVTLARVKAGFVQEALADLASYHPDYARSFVHHDLSPALVAAGAKAEAERLAGDPHMSGSAAAGFLSLARHAAEVNDRAWALQMIDRAEAVVQADRHEGYIRFSLAGLLARLGEPARAEGVAKQATRRMQGQAAENSSSLDAGLDAYSALYDACRAAGDAAGAARAVDGALQMFGKAADPGLRLQLVGHLVVEADATAARKVAATITDPYFQTLALAALIPVSQ